MSSSAKTLAGQVAIVTGGSRGIGLAICERLVEDGAHVVLTALDAGVGAESESVLRAKASDDQKIVFVRSDASSREEVEALVGQCLDRWSRLDIFVANAGIGDAAPLLGTSDEFWERMLRINLSSVLIGIQSASRAMIARSYGRIVAVASTNAFWMETGLAAYNASKAAVVALVRTAAMEMGAHGITVNAVAPGSIRTRMTSAMTEDRKRSATYLTQIPLGRFGTPVDVADAVGFFVSDQADWITGHVLVIDGGQTLGNEFP